MGVWLRCPIPVVPGLDRVDARFAKRWYSFYLSELIDTENAFLREYFSDCRSWRDVVAKVIRDVKYPFWLGRPDDTHTLNCFHGMYRRCYRIRHDFWQKASETAFLKVGDCEDSSFLTGAGLELVGTEYWVVLGLVYRGAEVLGGHAWVILRDMKLRTWFLIETTLDEVPQWFPEIDPTQTEWQVGALRYVGYLRVNKWACEVNSELVEGRNLVRESMGENVLSMYMAVRLAHKKREKKKLREIRNEWRIVTAQR